MVILRDVLDADLEVFFEHQCDPVANAMAAFPARDREAFLAHWARIRADPTAAVQTVVVAGRVAGQVMCWQQSGDRLVGYWIGRQFWGRGVATVALGQFVASLQQPLHAHAAIDNHASIRVLTKCGFTPLLAEGGASSMVGEDGVEELVLVLPIMADPSERGRSG